MTTTDITIRSATTEDAPAVARVHVDSWRFAYRELLPAALLDALSVEARGRFWEQVITMADPRASVLVAARNGAIAGFCACGPSREPNAPATEGEIGAIYVDPATTRQGVGRRLMDASLDHLSRNGFTGAGLWVLEGNRIGQGFYEGYGWTPTGRTKSESIHGTEVTEIHYHLDIDTRGRD
jgi:ribosomal protein S18 acetylase RimI-like enzyme